MRRMILSTVSVAAGCVLLLVFGIGILWQSSWEGARMESTAVLLPSMVEGTNLKAYSLSQYSGPSLEDRTSCTVTETAALLVENTGCYFATGAVVLEAGGMQLVFEVFNLPPGGKALVLEKDGQPYTTGVLSGCYGWEREERPECMGYVTAKATGGNVVTVTNLTQETVAVSKVCYRSQDPDSGIFLGGVSYSVEVRNLQPGESRQITPAHYGKNSRILYVVTWIEE